LTTKGEEGGGRVRKQRKEIGVVGGMEGRTGRERKDVKGGEG